MANEGKQRSHFGSEIENIALKGHTIKSEKMANWTKGEQIVNKF